MKEYYNKSIDEVLGVVSSQWDGLSEKEVKKRLQEDGKNILPRAKEDHVIKIFFRQFINPIIFILIVAATLSFGIGELLDAFFITGVIVFNALLGAFQEWRAGKKAMSLQNLIKVKVKVLRGGREKEIDAEEIVKGDIVLIESGDKIAADIRLLEGHNLSVDEAILTGESSAPSKNPAIIKEKKSVAERRNMLFAGCTVLRGRGKGVVVATSDDTEIGKIAANVLLKRETKSPLVIRMEKFTKQIAFYTAIIALLLTMLLYYRGEAPQEIFFAVVALSVSAIPEGLPVALTFALSIASSRMTRKNVLVKKLNAVESLGSCTVIASDKTGTLTLNEQTAKLILTPDQQRYEITGVGYNDKGKVADVASVKRIAKLGFLNNEAGLEKTRKGWQHYGDSIDVAFLALGMKAKIAGEQLKIIGRIPYESENKFSAVLFQEMNEIKITAKGSVEKVLSFCKNMQSGKNIKKLNKEEVLKQNELLASEGYRVIAMAEGNYKGKKKNEYDEADLHDLTFLGLVGFIDPIRKDAIEAIDKCRGAGIKVVMITGDHPLTAYTIAKELKLADDHAQVIKGSEIEEYIKKGPDELDKIIAEKTVFSRVSPLEKLEIVNSFRRMGEFVAVTGDGVNDAPALKAANIGVAIGSGTDVAKETGSMIITDDNFLSIVDGIEEGRVAYSNVRKVILMLLSTGVAEVLLFMMAILMNLPIPLLAVQILWLNLVTNGIQDVALAFEKKEPGIMKDKPRKPKERIFNVKLLEQTFMASIVMAIIVFFFWKALLDRGIAVEIARGYVLLLMVFMQNVHVFNCRSETRSLFAMKFSGNPVVFIAIFVTLGLHFLITQTAWSSLLGVQPMAINVIFYIFILAIPIVLVMEVYKFMEPKRRGEKS